MNTYTGTVPSIFTVPSSSSTGNNTPAFPTSPLFTLPSGMYNYDSTKYNNNNNNKDEYHKNLFNIYSDTGNGLDGNNN